MIDRKDWPEDARNAQAAFDEASWDAVEGYRDTGEMVPGMKDGKLYLYTVDEALRTRPDYEMRKKDVGEWRRNNLIAQFKARQMSGSVLPPTAARRLRTTSPGFIRRKFPEAVPRVASAADLVYDRKQNS